MAWVLSLQMRYRSPHQGSLAEWSKALAQGACPQGRGIEPHNCHCSSMLSLQNSDIPLRARRARTHRAVSSRVSKEYRKSKEQRHRDTETHKDTRRHKKKAEAPRHAERAETKNKESHNPGRLFLLLSSSLSGWFCGRLRPAASETPAAK